jgi:hypothetical protein
MDKMQVGLNGLHEVRLTLNPLVHLLPCRPLAAQARDLGVQGSVSVAFGLAGVDVADARSWRAWDCPELGAVGPRAKAVDGPFRYLEALDMHNWQDCTGLCWVNVPEAIPRRSSWPCFRLTFPYLRYLLV